YFTTNSQSSGNMLHVSEGDTVTGKYIDRTLPLPYTPSDQLSLTATTFIGYTVPSPQTPTTPIPPVTNPNANVTTASPPLDQIAMCNSGGGANVQLDKQVYTPNDVVSIAVVVPACNTDPNVIDIIGDGTRGTITISTNSAKLNNYQLIETGPNTGIFTGKIA